MQTLGLWSTKTRANTKNSMKYLIQITRSTRAERPTEQTIIADSKNITAGNFNAVSQNNETDNFFIFSADKNTVQFELMRILTIMPFTPFALKPGDGFRIIEYNYMPNLSEQREGSTIELRVYLDSEASIQKFATIDESIEWTLANLEPSDGYVLIDEQETSMILDCIPSLWISSDSTHIVQSKNLHSRVDKDRI
jgi:hypothetical protein